MKSHWRRDVKPVSIFVSSRHHQGSKTKTATSSPLGEQKQDPSYSEITTTTQHNNTITQQQQHGMFS